MIAERNRNMKMQSTADGEAIEMTVDANSMEHIMGLLTDLYSDPELAVIREYSTNAFDAHVEAGTTRPIEVTLPSPLSPFLTIKDYGVGLDTEGIKRIYSQYGASTKRGTNDQNGMLGLGCKSALTYTDQFTLVGRKDGTAYTVAITRDERGRGTMTVQAETETDEPNGVEVVIPVKRNNEIARKAEAFYKHWSPDTVLVNGEAPTPLEGLRVSDNMLVVERDRYATDQDDIVVMGNVAYPVPSDKLNIGLSRGRGYGEKAYRLVVTVGIGEVNFTPSREALMYTSTTEATLERIAAEFNANAEQSVQREIDAATTDAEAIAKMVEWRKMLANHQPTDSYTYQGRAIPTHYEDPRIMVSENPVPTYSIRGSNAIETTKYQVSAFADTLFVGGFDLEKLNINHRRKAQQYLASKGHSFKWIAWCKGTPIVEFIDRKTQIVDYETVIKEIKLPKKQGTGAAVQIAGSYSTIDAKVSTGTREKAAADIDQKRPVFYTDEDGWRGGIRYRDMLIQHFPDCYIVSFGVNRTAKFERDFPKARKCSEGIKDAYAKWLKGMSSDVKKGLVWEDAGVRHTLAKLDAAKIKDPALKKAVKECQPDISKAENDRRAFHHFRHHLGIKGHATAGNLPENPLDKYPLCEYVLQYNRPTSDEYKHLYLYVNEAYKATKTTKEV